MPQLIQMKGQRGVGDVELGCDLTGRHSRRSRTNEKTENSKAVFVSEGGQGSDGSIGFHISKIMEISVLAK